MQELLQFHNRNSFTHCGYDIDDRPIIVAMFSSHL